VFAFVDSTNAAIVAAVGVVFAALVTGIGGLLVVRVGRVGRAVQEVHVMVNARLDTALNRIDHLEQQLITSRAETLISQQETAAAAAAPATEPT